MLCTLTDTQQCVIKCSLGKTSMCHFSDSMLWLSWLTLFIKSGGIVEAWSSWSSINWVKRSMAHSSSWFWDHSVWGWGWELISSMGVWVSFCVSRLAWICFSLIIQPFLKRVSLSLSAWEVGKKKHMWANKWKTAGPEENNYWIYPLFEALGNMSLVNPPQRPRGPTWPGTSSPVPELAPATAALPVGKEPGSFVLLLIILVSVTAYCTFQNSWFIICSVFWIMFSTVPAVVRVKLSLHLFALPHHYAATEQLALLGMDSWHVAWAETWGPDGM